MITIGQLRQLSLIVKTETKRWANTGSRLDVIFQGMLDVIQAIKESGNSSGASAYEVYVNTTTDNPVLTEIEWINSLYGHDGLTPNVGANGNWWIGDLDTGVKAQINTPTPGMLFDIPKNAGIFWFGSIAELHEDFHLCDGSYVEGFGFVPDMRDKFVVGFNPSKPAVPIDVDDTTQNYGAIGNTGGLNTTTLGVPNLPPHSFKTVIDAKDSSKYLPEDGNLALEWSSNHRNGNQDYDFQGKLGIPTLGKTNTVGEGVAFDNRPAYYVVAYIVRVRGNIGCSSTDVIPTVTMTESGAITIPSNTWVEKISIIVISGTPTIEIPLLNTGELSGYKLYPINAEIPASETATTLVINMTGAGTIKVITKIYNI